MDLTPIRGKSLWMWLIPHWKFIKRLGITLLIVFLIGLVYLQFWIHIKFQPIVQNDPRYVSLRAFWNAPLDFQEEDLAYAHVPPTLNRLYKQLLSYDWYSNGAETFLRNYYDPQKRDTIPELDMAIFKPMLDNYIQDGLNMSKQIEEIVKTLSPGEKLPLYIKNFGHFSHFYPFVEGIISQQSDYLADRHNYDESFGLLMACFPLRLHCPRQDSHAYRDSLDYFCDMSRSATLLIPNVSSTVHLHNGLNTLNRLEPLIFQDILKDATKLAVLDDMRNILYYDLKRYDYITRTGATVQFNHSQTMDFIPGKPYRYYLHQLAKRKIPEMRFLKNLPYIGYYFLAGRKFSEEELAGLFRPFCLSETLNDYFYLRVFPTVYVDDVRQSIKDTSIVYDSLRLKIATRLYELETGKKVKSASDLVPAYLPTEPKNRTTGESYRWNEKGEMMEFQ